MGPFLVVGILVITVVTFALLWQQQNQQQAVAILPLAGGTLVLVTFWSLPWIRFTGIASLITSKITGWSLASAEPVFGYNIVSTDIQTILYFVLATACISLLYGGITIIGYETGHVLGLIQTGLSGIAIISLIFAAYRIQEVSTINLQEIINNQDIINKQDIINLQEIDFALNVEILTLGIGIWVAGLGLLISAVGGFLSQAGSTGTQHTRRERKHMRSRRNR